MRAITARDSRRTHNRRSSATWSLRLRPVWSLAPAGPAISVTRRSTAVWMSSSVGANAKRAFVELDAHLVEGIGDREPLLFGEQPHRREHVDVRARADQVVMGEPLVERQADAQRHQRVGRALAEPAVPERLRVSGGHRRDPGSASECGTPGSSLRWRLRPRLDREPPEPHEAGGVLVAERVVGLVGRELVVVEPAFGAPARDEAAAGLEAEPDLAGDVALGRVDERVERLAQRREPQPVVDELGVAGLEPGLLPHDVALERDRLEIRVREHQREHPGALVGLPALDPHPAVLDHVEPAEPVRADDGVQLVEDLVQRAAPRRRARSGTPRSKRTTTSSDSRGAFATERVIS